MYVDVAAIALILFYGFMGYRYGLTGALINLAGMVGGYLAAIFYAKPAGFELALRTGMSPLLAIPIASLVIFLLVTRAFYLLHLMIRKWLEKDKDGPSKLLTADRMGGLAFGLTKGSVIVGFLLWGLPTLLGSGALAKEMGLTESLLSSAVQSGIETTTRYGAGLIVEDPNAQNVIARGLAKPRQTIQELGTLAANPKLKQVTSDPAVAEAVRKQGLMGIVNSGAFDQVLADASFQKSLSNLGFQPRDGKYVSREDVGRFVQDVDNKMKARMAQIQTAANSNEIGQFLQDPEIQNRLKKGELSAVMQDPRLTKALGIAMASPGSTPGATPELPAGLPGGGPNGWADGPPLGR